MITNRMPALSQLIGRPKRAMQMNRFVEYHCHDQPQVNPAKYLKLNEETTIQTKIKSFSFVGAGSHLGFYVVLNANVSDYYCSSIESAGFKILLHNPTETARISDYGILISTGRETRVVITPKISTTSYIVQKVAAERRKCYFPNEVKLKFFRYCICCFWSKQLIDAQKYLTSSYFFCLLCAIQSVSFQGHIHER